MTAHGKLGVYGRLSSEAMAILELADAFRAEYCLLLQDRHDRLADLRYGTPRASNTPRLNGASQVA